MFLESLDLNTAAYSENVLEQVGKFPYKQLLLLVKRCTDILQV